MKKQTQTTRPQPKLEELIPNEAYRTAILKRLYEGDPILGENGIFTELLQAFVNAALEGEIEAHLAKERANGSANRRNGLKRKKLRTASGPIEIVTPRDREGTFDPKLVGKWDRELNTGLDEIIIGLYAKGFSVNDVRNHLEQIYGLEVSTATISTVTDKVLDKVLEWQQRPLDPCYSIIYLDALHYKIREDGKIKTKATYVVFGVTVEGERDVLGLYQGFGSEGAGEWGLILEDLRRRGVEEVLFFCVDGLKGFSEVIQQVYPHALVQRCIVHMIRNSTRFVSYKERRAICRDLAKIYKAANREQAALALEKFGETWDKKYPKIKQSWLEAWDDLMVFMDYPEAIRRMIYTTNPVEALHRILRKVTKTKGAWSNDKGLFKQLFLAITYHEKSWKRKAHSWAKVQHALVEKFGERYEKWLVK